MLEIVPKNPLEGAIYIRNEGTCNSYILPTYWGLGGESRGTKSNIPDPYAVEQGIPSYVSIGYEEKWLLNLMVIDTRGTKHRKHCTECRCNRFNLPKNFYNVTLGIDGKPLSSNYKGGIFCCQDNLQCKLKKDFEAPTRKLALRYKIAWVDWSQQQIPVRFYILDSTDRVRKNGSQIIHDCQDGRILYTSKPTYGDGKEPGNEKGYVVGMSGSYPKPGSIKIKDGETLTVETRYKSGFLTGAMGHMYIYLADRLA
ncbi:hypothetical protein KIW84_032024 [Lathyrus oleraceus]|uniref:Stress up-regulated Nod 19 protein n=1 Tax=Pisum sativum TaxID=3888 RepID=A0A9D5B151_PEA|nr:hypothetical protein KIW84_032024 [Pisum sativum]